MRISRKAAAVAARLLAWHAGHGRHDLPWQRRPTPYRVWVSEVMLQQTQVATVARYFERFVARFPTVRALAAAPLDEVLHLWSGLGYYARARNLHRAAQAMVADHGGRFPRGLQAVQALPGIGRSTAGAILALSRGERHPILDGNAKRVLARIFAVEGWPGVRATQERLWELAEACTPPHDARAYTQAIMDLGATVCTRTRPACGRCPLRRLCRAHVTGRQEVLPAARPRPAARRLERAYFLLAVRDDRSVLLERRPSRGVWGGLWSLPQFETKGAATAWARDRFGQSVPGFGAGRQLLHRFTHFDLDIRPLTLRVPASGDSVDGGRYLWYNSRAPAKLGLAAPVAKLIHGQVSDSAGRREKRIKA